MNPKRIYKPGSAEKVNGAGQPGRDEGEEKTSPFPLEHLPPAAREVAKAIASTERTPETLAGCCVLGILSASIGAGLQVKSGPDRVTRANINILASAESGSGKSETYRHAMKPFGEFECELVEYWRKHTLPKVEADKEVLQAEIEGLKRDAAKNKGGVIEREAIRAAMQDKKARLLELEVELQDPVLTVDNITTERLAVLLANRSECLFSTSADARSIIDNVLGRYAKKDKTDEAVYLTGWTGDKCRVDRQGRPPVNLNHPCLAVLWLVQPDKIGLMLAERSLTDGGLLPRFLLCHTRAEPLPITENAAGIPHDTAQRWGQLVKKLLKTFRLSGEPITIQPTAEALQALNGHWNSIVERRKKELRDIGPYAARWNEQAWRIAVCLHAGIHGENAGERMLAADTAASAIILADWFAGEQLRILARGRDAARREKFDEVLKLLADTPEGIRGSGVYRKRIVPTAEEAHSLLAKMEADGELQGRDEKPEGGGHITRIYTRARKRA
jgi:hypothetical protein